jgi:F0F1-type ATP synthase delta subunit
MAFYAGRWADAFIAACGHGLSKSDEAALKVNVEAGVSALKALYGGLERIHRDDLSGSSDAARLDAVLGKALDKAMKSDSAKSPERDAGQRSRRILVLLVKNGFWKQAETLIALLEERLETMQGILRVYLTAASEADKAFLSGLEQTLKEQTGAQGVNMQVSLNPALIGGCRIRINGELLDYSISGQLKKMKETMRVA